MTSMAIDDAPNGVQPASRVVAQCLRVDHVTVQVIEALRAAGVNAILLKGPAVVDLLYRSDPSARAYLDTDLLVAPAQTDQACTVLRRLGFEPLDWPLSAETGARGAPLSVKLPHESHRHAEAWVRPHDRAVIDLHRTLHGAEQLDPVEVFETVRGSAVPIDVLGTSVDAPSPPMRLLHAVLHLRPKDNPTTQAWRDLERAIDHPVQEWHIAAEVARTLGLDRQMGPLLRLVPRGGQLADCLGLPSRWPAELRIEYAGVSSSTGFQSRLRPLRRHEQARLLAEKLLPPPSYLRAHWSLARRGALGLALVYAYRLVLVPVRLVEIAVGAKHVSGEHVSWDEARSRFVATDLPIRVEPRSPR